MLASLSRRRVENIAFPFGHDTHTPRPLNSPHFPGSGDCFTLERGRWGSFIYPKHWTRRSRSGLPCKIGVSREAKKKKEKTKKKKKKKNKKNKHKKPNTKKKNSPASGRYPSMT